MATLDVLTLDEAEAVVGGTTNSRWTDVLPAWITATSLRFEKLVGPVVQRTITGELHDGGYGSVFLANHPNLSVTSVTEYDNLVSKALTVESNTVKPVDAYIAERYVANPTLLGNEIRRRSSNGDSAFPAGRRNVSVTYVAGRFANVTAVDERFKTGARLILQNLFRTVQPAVATLGDFEDAAQLLPTFTIPRAVYEALEGLFPGEIQMPVPV